MNNNLTSGPNLIHGGDVHSLSIGVAKAVLRGASGTPAQREKLSRFVTEYESALAQGSSRDAAAALAQVAIGF